jgi:Predicted nucleotide-binding protein containing TIR-like domain
MVDPRWMGQTGLYILRSIHDQLRAAEVSQYCEELHGRDSEARDAITEFLETIGVKVVTWSYALSELDLNDRDIWRIVGKGFELSGAVIVLSTPDEVSFLRPELWQPYDSPTAKGPRFQPRQNVLLELGYALLKGESRTIHITVGDVAPLRIATASGPRGSRR